MNGSKILKENTKNGNVGKTNDSLSERILELFLKFLWSCLSCIVWVIVHYMVYVRDYIRIFILKLLLKRKGFQFRIVHLGDVVWYKEKITSIFRFISCHYEIHRISLFRSKGF